jgi:diguanylate cyclase (GGDEF)-like protein
MAQMPGFHWTTDRNLFITAIWGKDFAARKIPLETVLGHSIGEFLGCAEPYHSPVSQHHDAVRGLPSQVEAVWKDRVLEIRLEPLRNLTGEITGCLASAVDITARKINEDEVHYQARHDALTGLANYREFIDRLEQEVRRAERSHNTFTILLLDLDGLKRINDIHGHLSGNRALQRLAAVMNEHCRSTDLAVRYGGDEFAVILIDSDQGMAEQVARRIETGLSTDLRKPALSVSIGIGIYPDDGRAAADLIESADRHLYRYKRAEHRRVLSAAAPDTAKE